MTNFEYLLENEKDLVKDVLSICVAIDKKNKLRKCNDISFCDECQFNGASCTKDTLAWLDSKYEEPLHETVKIQRDTPKHTLIWVKDSERENWVLRFFSHFDSTGYPMCFISGDFDSEYTTPWKYAKSFEMGVAPYEDEKGAEE